MKERCFWTRLAISRWSFNRRSCARLQEKEFERLGSTKTIPVNVRLVAATNRDLAQMVADKEFRSDLYYRLRVFPILLPPLRERREDIPLLVRYFVDKHSRQLYKKIETIHPETMRALTRWDWPGNIRELENFIERAVILTKGPVLRAPLSELEVQEEATFLTGFLARSEGTRAYPPRSPRNKRQDRWTQRSGGSPRTHQDYPQFQDEEAWDRAKRLYVVRPDD